MTALNTIFDDNFDIAITTKPNFFDENKRSHRTVSRGVTTLLMTTEDAIIGVVDRIHFDVNSHDAYICTVVSTSLTDAKNIIKGLKKVCATYIPTSVENMIEWEGGNWKIFTYARYVYQFTVIVRKAIIEAY